MSIGLFAVVLIRNGQLLTTFCTTCRQNTATILRCHTLAETMFVGATAVVGLECSFHGAIFYFMDFICNGRQRYSFFPYLQKICEKKC